MDVCRHDPEGLCHAIGWGIKKRKLLLNEVDILFSHSYLWNRKKDLGKMPEPDGRGSFTLRS